MPAQDVEMPQSDARSVHPLRGAALAAAFGSAVAMWAAGYFGRIPPPEGWLPPAGLLMTLLAIQIMSGVMLGRAAEASARTAIIAGLGAGVIHLLVLGALLREDHSPADVLIGAGGLMATCAALTALGFLVGRTLISNRRSQVNWTALLALIAVCGTFVLVIAGGLVTGHEAGLAVVDWPNTDGRLMFLYPLSRMTGGVYYEHAHRLYGALVGLTTLALAIQIWRTRVASQGTCLTCGYDMRGSPSKVCPECGIDQRAGQPLGLPRFVRRLAIMAVVLVIAQGILGGLRVTGEFTLATDAAETRPNLALAVVHGVLAHVFLGLVVLISAMTATGWTTRRYPLATSDSATTRKLATGLLVILFGQLVLGALYRHLNSADETPRGMLHAILGLHIAVAALVLGWIVVQGLRQVTRHANHAVVRRLGVALLIVVMAQVILGVLALLAVIGRSAAEPIPAWEIIITTAHQATGAALVSVAVLSAAWIRRSERQ